MNYKKNSTGCEEKQKNKRKKVNFYISKKNSLNLSGFVGPCFGKKKRKIMISTQLRFGIKIKQGFPNEFKNESLNYALSFIDFNNITLNLRNEIGILYEKTQEYYHNKRDIKYKITLDDIAILLSQKCR